MTVEPRADPGKVVAVISAYRPPPGLDRVIAAARQQIAEVILVDDTGEGSPYQPRARGVTVIANDVNRGLAFSLNRGIRRARELGFNYVLTLDQDAELPPGYVRELLSGLRKCQCRGGMALTAGPEFVNAEKERSYGAVHRFDLGQCSLNVMQSGMLIDLRAIDIVGGFRESFFIDGLEQDFLTRLHRLGYHTLLVPKLALEHTPGEPEPARFLTKTVHPAQHSVERHYYITRNFIRYAIENRRAEPEESRLLMHFLIRHIAKGVLLERDRFRKSQAILVAIRHGVTGRLGRAPARLSPTWAHARFPTER